MTIGPGPEIQWRAQNAVEQWWLAVMHQQNRLDLPDLDLPDADKPPTPQDIQRMSKQVTAQSVDVELYVEALWRFRKAVLFTIHHVSGGAELVEGLDEFDSQIPDLEVLHDVTSSFEQYLVHAGRFRRGQQGLVLGTSLGATVDGLPAGGSGLSWDEYGLNTNTATQAARSLYERVRGFLEPLL